MSSSPIEVSVTINSKTLDVTVTANKTEGGEKHPIDIVTDVKIIPLKPKKRVIDLTNSVDCYENYLNILTEDRPKACKRRKISVNPKFDSSSISLPLVSFCKHLSLKGYKCWFEIEDNNNNEFCPFHQTQYLKNIEKDLLKKEREKQKLEKSINKVEKVLFKARSATLKKKAEKNKDSHKALCNAMYVTQCKHIYNNGEKCKSKIPIEQDLCAVHEGVLQKSLKIEKYKSARLCNHIYSSGLKCILPADALGLCTDHYYQLFERCNQSLRRPSSCKCATHTPCSCKSSKNGKDEV
jgi:hypothetical protein